MSAVTWFCYYDRFVKSSFGISYDVLYNKPYLNASREAMVTRSDLDRTGAKWKSVHIEMTPGSMITKFQQAIVPLPHNKYKY